MPSALVVPVGMRFGRLAVVNEGERVSRAPHRGEWRMFTLVCECGGTITTRLNSLRSGRVNSCGCLVAETNQANAPKITKHGHAGLVRSVEYKTWTSIVKRCENPSHQSWRYYGGRGIKICDQWRHDFQAFFAEVGNRPSNYHSIDRIDNDGHYEPGNVRWATASEQALNRRPKYTA